eukprot:c9816_g1_i1.p1 GENE.c9816_g1_i1~~c9816_g1_i1.p1  ORF type:complete len:113 (-),score=25.42 c9816_g1_i1:254-592(-)
MMMRWFVGLLTWAVAHSALVPTPIHNNQDQNAHTGLDDVFNTVGSMFVNGLGLLGDGGVPVGVTRPDDSLLVSKLLKFKNQPISLESGGWTQRIFENVEPVVSVSQPDTPDM